MWNYLRRTGGDVCITSGLILLTTLIAVNATEGKPIKQIIIGGGLIGVHLLHIRKAWEAQLIEKELTNYKENFHRQEILTSDVEEYMGDKIADMNHLIEAHEANQGKGKYKHEVNIYTMPGEPKHYYVVALGLNELD